jgi:hypothetical protein
MMIQKTNFLIRQALGKGIEFVIEIPLELN